MGHVTVVGGCRAKAPVTYKANFSDNTWAQIIDACHKNRVPNTWVVGNSKPMLIDGAEYQIDIIGKNHDDYADGSGKAPLTFQLHDCYAQTYGMNNSNTNNGGWTNCVMRTTHLPAILAKMPTEVQNGIRKVTKLTSEGNGSINIKATEDDLFLLCEEESFGEAVYARSGEGTQYEYYRMGNSTIKNYQGSAAIQWERSPRGNNGTEFCEIAENGTQKALYASAHNGIAYAFCF